MPSWHACIVSCTLPQHVRRVSPSPLRPPTHQAGLHPTTIELVSVEEVTLHRTSPFHAVLRAVAAFREPSALRAVASAGGNGASSDVAALTADPALQQLSAGGSAADRLLSDAGSANSGKQAVQLSNDGSRRVLQSGRKLRQQVRSAMLDGSSCLSLHLIERICRRTAAPSRPTDAHGMPWLALFELQLSALLLHSPSLCTLRP